MSGAASRSRSAKQDKLSASNPDEAGCEKLAKRTRKREAKTDAAVGDANGAGVEGEGRSVKRQACGDGVIGEKSECLPGYPMTGPRWCIPKPEKGYKGEVQVGAIEKHCRQMLQQALDGDRRVNDVEFLLDDGSVVRGNRGMLSASCDYFKRLFQTDCMESESGRVRIRDCCAGSFRAFLEFVYMGTSGKEMDGADGRELYILADLYDVKELKRYLLEGIDQTCVVSAAWFGSGVESGGDVLHACTQRASLSKVSESELEGLPVRAAVALLQGHIGGKFIEGFEFVQRWCARNGRDGDIDGNKDAVETLLDHVDFRAMLSSELLEVVQHSRIVSTERMARIFVDRLKKEEYLKSRFERTRQTDFEDDVVQKGFPRVAICGGSGSFAVLSFDLCRVKVFDGGRLVREFGSPGDGEGQFSDPCGLAVSGGGTILISDNGHHRVHVFNQEGAFIRTFGSKGSGKGQFDDPQGMCFNHLGQVLVCDYGNHRIQIFCENGEYVSEIEVDIHPQDISVDLHDGRFVVLGYKCETEGEGIVDDGEDKWVVCLFNAFGKLLKSWDVSALDGKDDPVDGVCLSVYGHVMVYGFKLGCVKVLDEQGSGFHTLQDIPSVTRIVTDVEGRLHVLQYRDCIKELSVNVYEPTNAGQESAVVPA